MSQAARTNNYEIPVTVLPITEIDASAGPVAAPNGDEAVSSLVLLPFAEFDASGLPRGISTNGARGGKSKAPDEQPG